jgi:hypothetical protein
VEAIKQPRERIHKSHALHALLPIGAATARLRLTAAKQGNHVDHLATDARPRQSVLPDTRREIARLVGANASKAQDFVLTALFA